MTRIVTTPGTCGGEPRIDGTRIRVRVIQECRQDGLSVETIADDLDLPPEAVTAALAYRVPRKRRSNRHTWQDERRVRRMAVLLMQERGITLLVTAAKLDKFAEKLAEFEEWPDALKAAEHYLREIGRTKTDG